MKDENPRTAPDAEPREAPEAPRRRLIGRKLLVAVVGVATISYVACRGTQTSGNLVAPPPQDVQPDRNVSSGNLVPPPPDDVQDVQSAEDAQRPPDRMVVSGNLVAPPPEDGGMDGGGAR